MKLNMRAAAVLVWLPTGKEPTVDSFDAEQAKPPPVPNPEPWWYLEDAVVHAREVVSNHGKVPWIKTGETLLGPVEITQAYSGLRAMRALDDR